MKKKNLENSDKLCVKLHEKWFEQVIFVVVMIGLILKCKFA